MESGKPRGTEPSPKAEDRPAADNLLLYLIGLVEDQEGEFGITLAMGGTVVTGYLIGAPEYLRRFADFMSRQVSAEDAETARAVFLEDAERVRQQIVEERERGWKAPRSFIHMKEARLVSGGRLIPATGSLLWRGWLDRVDGFSLWTIEPDRESSA